MSEVEHVWTPGEVVGYRAWTLIGDLAPAAATRLQPRFVRLESATQSTETAGVDGVWPTNRWIEAKCLADPLHNEPGVAIPVESCSCGVYSAKSLVQLHGLHYGAYGDFADKAIGEIAYAGKVIEGGQGWRGERARIKRLWLPHRLWMYAEPLARAYRVPVGFARFGRDELAIVIDEDNDYVEVD